MQTCPACSRVSPREAWFCHHDGRPLRPGPAPAARLDAPLVFPSARACWTVDELVSACLAEWPTAAELLLAGDLAQFFTRLGRPELAAAARQAAAFPDADAALDRFLRCVSDAPPPARLEVAPQSIAFAAQPGDEGCWVLHLRNAGGGALYGTATCDAPWLALGRSDGPGVRWFCGREAVDLPVFLRPRAVRASARPQSAQLLIASSGGNAIVAVTLDAPPRSFPAGALSGATSPRELAGRARQAPREAAALFESGAVARWYQANGWSYPLAPGPGGVALVSEYFDLLGLSRPAAVELSEQALTVEARPGESVERVVRVRAADNRPAYARARADSPWLCVAVDCASSDAQVRVSITAPDRPGQTVTGRVTITANGRRTFAVPVTLRIVAPPPPIDWLPVTAPPVPAPVRPAPPPPPPVLLTPVARRAPARAAPLALAVGLPLALLGVVLVAAVVAALALPRPGPAESAPPLAGGTPAAIDGPSPPTPQPRPAPPQSAEEQPPPRAIDVRPRQRPSAAPPALLLPDMEHRTVEVVFCIDTTGSMGGLLDGAKKKIWAMCNQIASGRPTPALRVGLVAYRDRGDEYVTRVVNLTPDLDAIYGELTALQAAGGGDAPESVNQALDDAVNRMRWSSDKKVLRIVFLVGDAPPHMDYEDDVKYPETCQKAVARGVFINTIQCGRDPACQKAWKDVAAKAKGEYVAIPQGGGVVTVVTKFDAPLAELGKELFATALVFGDAEAKKRGERVLDGAKRLTGTTAADRVAYAARTGRIGPYDLFDAIKAKRVKLAAVKEAELPDALRKVRGAAARQAHLDKVAARRKELFAEALELEKSRAEAIAAVRKKRGGGRDGFDEQVLGLMRKQAKAFDIEY